MQFGNWKPASQFDSQLSVLSLSSLFNASPACLLFNFAVQLICMRFAIIEFAKGEEGGQERQVLVDLGCSCSCESCARPSKVFCHHDTRQMCVNRRKRG